MVTVKANVSQSRKILTDINKLRNLLNTNVLACMHVVVTIL